MPLGGRGAIEGTLQVKGHDTVSGTHRWARCLGAALRSTVPGSLSKIEFKEVKSYSRPIGRGVRTERPPVIGVENTPGLDMSDRSLDSGAQAVYLGIEFLLPVKQFPAWRLLKRGDEA